jgi:hypothetical protein
MRGVHAATQVSRLGTIIKSVLAFGTTNFTPAYPQACVIGAQKLGQPVANSNFGSEPNRALRIAWTLRYNPALDVALFFIVLHFSKPSMVATLLENIAGDEHTLSLMTVIKLLAAVLTSLSGGFHAIAPLV